MTSSSSDKREREAEAKKIADAKKAAETKAAADKVAADKKAADKVAADKKAAQDKAATDALAAKAKTAAEAEAKKTADAVKAKAEIEAKSARETKAAMSLLTATGTSVAAGQKVTQAMVDLGYKGKVGNTLSKGDATFLQGQIKKTGAVYLPKPYTPQQVIQPLADPVAIAEKSREESGGVNLRPAALLAPATGIASVGPGTVKPGALPAATVSKKDAAAAALTKSGAIKQGFKVTQDMIDLGYTGKVGDRINSSNLKNLQGLLSSATTPAGVGPGTVKPGTLPAAPAPATGIASVIATGGPGTYPPATNTSGTVSTPLTGTTSGSPGTANPGQLPAAPAPRALTTGEIQAQSLAAKQARAAEESKIAAAATKAKKDAAALGLLKSGNIAAGTKVTQEMIDLGYRGTVGRALSPSDVAAINKMVKATGVTYTPPAGVGPGTVKPGSMPAATTTTATNQNNASDAALIAKANTQTATNQNNASDAALIAKANTQTATNQNNAADAALIAKANTQTATNQNNASDAALIAKANTQTATNQNNASDAALIAKANTGGISTLGTNGAIGTTTTSGIASVTGGGGTTGGGTTGGGTTGGGTTGGGTTGGGTTGGGTGGGGTGGGGTGGGGTGGGGTTNTGSGPTTCPAGYKLVTDAQGVRSCVLIPPPPPPPPATTTGIASLRPVVAPYHKSTSVASLEGYKPFIPGR
jgi:hypothetical protein